MKKLQTVRGTKDILEEDLLEIESIKFIWGKIATLYGFNMVDTPIMEDSEVFKKTLGATSDIIKRETYTFKDRSNNEITLRPEGTAPIVRFFINNKLHNSLPQKLSYVGPMFRYDRPQKGRFRQFYQCGAEIIGEKDIYADIELINLAKHFVNEAGISDKSFKIHINSLGDEESRKKYVSELQKFFQDHKKKLTSESLERLKKNPLRILDTKNNEEKKLLIKAPKLKNFLTTESSDIFEEFKEGCKQLKISITLDDNLVRGLDYYNNICYEFISNDIGAQDSFLAGGRYDGLIKKMGGPDYPGCGFAVGIERLLMLKPHVIEDYKEFITPDSYVVIAVGKENKIKAMEIMNQLREVVDKEDTIDLLCQSSIDFICRDNLSKGLRYASEKKANFAIIIGQEEILNKEVTIKDLKKRAQKKIEIKDLKDIFH
tara:strand:+ start:645 stop:1934 length:1290 start_codon:yes stop_codon:yes gene_type:complete